MYQVRLLQPLIIQIKQKKQSVALDSMKNAYQGATATISTF